MKCIKNVEVKEVEDPKIQKPDDMIITESGTPEIKHTLTRHLEEALDMHERISNYMVEKGWYHAYDTNEQIQMNLKHMDTAMKLPTL